MDIERADGRRVWQPSRGKSSDTELLEVALGSGVASEHDGEDESRIRTDHGPENIALLRKIAMNLAKSERSNKRGIKAKLRLAGWDDTYLLKLLQAGLPKIQAH